MKAKQYVLAVFAKLPPWIPVQIILWFIYRLVSVDLRTLAWRARISQGLLNARLFFLAY
jgi:hypothetical protein